MNTSFSRLYTVESVTSGHPDKVCDQISDAILDACLAEDPMSRVAVETFGGHGKLFIGGEVTTRAHVPYEEVARRVYRDIGHTGPLEITSHIVEQSPDIACGVDTGGAGDQGIMYGYATNETDAYVPKGVAYAHALARALEKARRDGTLPWVKPDGKTQVTLENGLVKSALVSTEHAEDVPQEEIIEGIRKNVMEQVLGPSQGYAVLVNPTGRFTIGGFDADTGLTGRKIMVDTYGGLIPHGGGAFSGKDPTKVDRSAAYMARFAAKNVVANGFADDCFVSVAYAIGRAEPLMVEAHDSKGNDLSDIVRKYFDFRPRAIIEELDLRRPIYQRTAAYGHFGRTDVPWEQIIRL